MYYYCAIDLHYYYNKNELYYNEPFTSVGSIEIKLYYVLQYMDSIETERRKIEEDFKKMERNDAHAQI